MANAPVNRPKAIQYLNGGTPAQRGKNAVASSTAFYAYQFVKTPGALTKCAASDTVVYGLALEDASATTATPPDVLYAGYTNPLDVNDTYFLVNITDASGTIGSGTTTQGAVTLGTSYELVYAGSGDTKVQMLNAAATSNAFFKAEAFWPEDASTDKNGRVICSIAATRQ